ncbi:MAG: response regulator transcription factor [Bacteroidales bacterium]|nr:response regulator transcription factor [Bacteroidales bacterium]
MESKIKIAVVDDEELITRALVDFLNKQEGLSVCLQSNDGNSFLDELKTISELPDIVVLDLKMKNSDGIDINRKLKKMYPEIKTIVVSSYYKDSYLGYMMKEEVNAFLSKDIKPEVLVEAIMAVYRKGFFLTSGQMDAIRGQISSKTSKPTYSNEDDLTIRELEVLEMICQQYTTSDIAEKLFISKRTVEGHRNNLLLKTGVKNIAGLVIYAVQRKLIDADKII